MLKPTRTRSGSPILTMVSFTILYQLLFIHGMLLCVDDEYAYRYVADVEYREEKGSTLNYAIHDRHVKLPKAISRWLPHYKPMKEEEWRSLGVQQSSNWEHYMVHGKLGMGYCKEKGY